MGHALAQTSSLHHAPLQVLVQALVDRVARDFAGHRQRLGQGNAGLQQSRQCVRPAGHDSGAHQCAQPGPAEHLPVPLALPGRLLPGPPQEQQHGQGHQCGPGCALAECLAQPQHSACAPGQLGTEGLEDFLKHRHHIHQHEHQHGQRQQDHHQRVGEGRAHACPQLLVFFEGLGQALEHGLQNASGFAGLHHADMQGAKGLRVFGQRHG